MLDKKEVRKTFKNKRNLLNEEMVDEASERIIVQLKNYFDFTNKIVHVFLPIRKFKEVNLYPFIDFLHENNVQVVTSITNRVDNTLTHVELKSNTSLEEDSWGIPTPIKASLADETNIDVVIVPLLAFDKNGHRVGYGKGYYDRFLSEITAHKIGVSLFEVLYEPLDIDQYDIPLDVVITPTKTYVINAKE